VTPADEQKLRDFIAGVDGFGDWGHTDKIRMFAWLQHFLFKKTHFTTADITACYGALSFKPSNTSQLLIGLENKELLRNRNGYYGEGKFLATYNEKHGTHDITLNIRQQVKDLINSVPNITEKEFMNEAEICLRHGAARGTIIMVWSIAFYHLCQWILKHHLPTFDARIPVYSKKWKVTDLPIIEKYDDFGDEMSEREVIEVCNSAGIITGDLHKILVKNLGTRNSAAHPSSVLIGQLQAEALIDDLIKNVILAMPI
jgi:hypothetical protein